MMFTKPLIIMSSLAITLAVSTSADAVNRYREKMTNATGNCQAALPAFEGQIRKRPLAVQNEGTSNAFVTCSLTTDTDFGTSEGTEGYAVWFINNSASVKTVDCTGVIGRALVGSPTFIVKSVSVGAGATAFLVWDATDNGGNPFDAALPVNVSCNLPVGTGISNSYVWYQVDVGA